MFIVEGNGCVVLGFGVRTTIAVTEDEVRDIGAWLAEHRPEYVAVRE